jgi:hypothetical protein
VGPRIYRKLKLLVGSFRKDTILLTECSILDSWYETGSNFINNCWGAADYTSLVGGPIVMYITASNLKDLLPAHIHTHRHTRTHTMTWINDVIIKLSKEQRAPKWPEICYHKSDYLSYKTLKQA